MSAKVMGQVYDYLLTPSEREVLMAIADHADHNGENAFPSLRFIAWKLDMTERGVWGIVRRLRKSGALVEQRHSGYRRPTTFRVVLAALERKPAFEHDPDEKDEPRSTKAERRSSLKKEERPTPIELPKDEREPEKDEQAGSYKPSSEPSDQPSNEPSARVRARESSEIEIPTRPQSPAEIEKEQKAFRKEAETVWLETVTPLGSIYTDTVALKVAGQHALMALRFGTPGQILAAIRARALRETTPRRIAELTRLYVGDELQRNAIASQRAEMRDEVIEGPRLTSRGLRPIAAAARAVVAAVAS